MTYEYTCKNQSCSNKEKVLQVEIKISEYSEEKLPICEVCKEKTKRVYTSVGIGTFGDGYKS